VKLSIVILCWNNLEVIRNCLRSIYSGTHSTDFEVIVSDNGSADGSTEFIRANFPQAHVIENGANLKFSKGNNVGIRASKGEYVLILNSDTIIHEGSLDRWIEFADRHPEAGGFACRVLNPDGSYQGSARPLLRRAGMVSFWLYRFRYIFDVFLPSGYIWWKGDSERPIGWQAGCCLLVRAELLKRLGGFDEQFDYHCEDVDLCRRIWDAGYPIVYTPDATITHLVGQSVKSFHIAFELDKYRSQYRYYYKYFGRKGARRCRHAILARLWIRRRGYGVVGLIKPSDRLKTRLELYRAAAVWNRRVDPVEFAENGKEPEIDLAAPLHVPP
jgi:hypothetical protein